MENQISFFDTALSAKDEQSFIDTVLPLMKYAVEYAGGDPNWLTVTPTKTAGTTVSIRSSNVFWLKLRKKNSFIKLPRSLKDLVPENSIIQDIKAEPQNIKIMLDEQHPLSSFKDLMAQAATEICARWPKSFDCCSRYAKCSDAKRCVNPNKELALACGYRKILNSGKIFYGENRNID